MLERQSGREAIRHFQRVLEQRPTKDDHELSSLTRCLGEFREDMIALHRQRPSPEVRECLAHLNAVVSVAMGMHFPLGQPPWDEFGKAKVWLTAVVARVEGMGPATT